MLMHANFLTSPLQAPHVPRLKRKHSQIEIEELSHWPDDQHPRKRPNTLEGSLALLSLNAPPMRSLMNQAITTLHPRPSAHSYALPHQPGPEMADYPIVEMDDADSGPAELPEVESPDVHMKTSTWYEKEKDRIVVLDLDASEDEGSRTSSPEPGDFTISGALLSRLSIPSDPFPSPVTSQELVLYRPSPWKIPEDMEKQSPLWDKRVDSLDATGLEHDVEYVHDDPMEID